MKPSGVESAKETSPVRRAEALCGQGSSPVVKVHPRMEMAGRGIRDRNWVVAGVPL